MSARWVTNGLAAALTAGIGQSATGQISYGADVALTPHYVWRGRIVDEGWMALPDAYVAYRLGSALSATAGAWSTIELGSRDSTVLHLARRWFGETDPWIEVAASGPVDVAVGWTRHLFPAGSLPNTSEVYARVEDLELPVIVPRISAWWSLGAAHERYLEGALPVRVPFWNGVLLPVGSILVTPTVGYNASRTSTYFARRGFTHLDLAAALTIGPVDVGRFRNAVRVEGHWQRSYDPSTKFMSLTETRSGRGWVAFEISVFAPRCQSPRELCPSR